MEIRSVDNIRDCNKMVILEKEAVTATKIHKKFEPQLLSTRLLFWNHYFIRKFPAEECVARPAIISHTFRVRLQQLQCLLRGRRLRLFMDGRPACMLLKDRKRVMWDSCSKLVLGLNLQLILVTISDKIYIYVWASVAQRFFALTHHESWAIYLYVGEPEQWWREKKTTRPADLGD